MVGAGVDHGTRQLDCSQRPWYRAADFPSPYYVSGDTVRGTIGIEISLERGYRYRLDRDQRQSALCGYHEVRAACLRFEDVREGPRINGSGGTHGHGG